jgi:hypothetical protein
MSTFKALTGEMDALLFEVGLNVSGMENAHSSIYATEKKERVMAGLTRLREIRELFVQLPYSQISQATIKIEIMESMPAARSPETNINPFHHDAYHMGMSFSKNVLIMMANHDTESAKYMILINTKTGERVKLLFPEDWQ